MDYIERQEAAGFKVGDLVKITRSAAAYELGWQNTWPLSMDGTVGRVGTIKKDCGAAGLTVSFGPDELEYEYPYFALMAVGKISRARTRAGLKVPAYLIMSKFGKRSVVLATFAYGRNGNGYDADVAKMDAELFIRNNLRSTNEWWVERGWVTVRLPRRRVS
jgi:hypothetical protein